MAMKRAICVCLLSSIVLTGCVSKADYEQLEERVSRLEQEQSRINESTTTTPETSAVADPSISESDTEASNQESSTNYSLEGMSAEEIYAECKSIYQTLSGCSGMTKDEYMRLLNVPSNELYWPHFYFDGYYDETITDCITCVYFDGVTEQMNGTMECVDNPPMTVYMRISDYQTAEAFYNLIVSDKYKDIIVSNDQEGTSWSASVLASDGYNYWPVLELAKSYDAYSITFTIRNRFN
jgi:outer membrane murein-binding lipoprotein Lpp